MSDPRRNGNGATDVEPILVPVPTEARRLQPIKVPQAPSSADIRELRVILANVVMELVPAVNAISGDTADNTAQILALSVAFNKVSGRLQSFFTELRESAREAIREAVRDARREIRDEVHREVQESVPDAVEEAVEEAIEKTNPGVPESRVKEIATHAITDAELAKARGREAKTWQVVCIVLTVLLTAAITVLVKR